MICAFISDNLVVDIKTIPTEEEYHAIADHYQNAVDITDYNPMPAIGWQFVGNTIVPPPGYTATPSIKITKLALRQRLTFAELCALEGAANTDVRVKALKGNLDVATYVDLARPDTIQAANILVSLGLITADRANVVLTTPPTELEKYKGNE